MAPRAKKVCTPGSQPVNQQKRGRPKKKILNRSRKGNYRTKYQMADFLRAVQDIERHKMTLGQAAKHYGIPKTTLHDRIKGKAGQKLGRPTELSMEEEEIMVQRLIIMGQWGFPLTTKDLIHMVKEYLDSMGRTSRFEDNRPGHFFVAGFLKRHPELTVRTASLLKRSKASLTKEVVGEFFDRYEQVAAGVPARNVLNYDETNLQVRVRYGLTN